MVVIVGKQRTSYASARKPNFQTKTPMYFSDQSPRRSFLIIPWGGAKGRFMIWSRAVAWQRPPLRKFVRFNREMIRPFAKLGSVGHARD